MGIATPSVQRHTLEETSHRPWPLPDGSWLQAQTWCDLLFAHWRVSAEQLRRVVPETLALHLYEDGSAWLGITPFVVTGLRARGTPPVPWLSSFPELNVRTYVEVGGKPGIYFISLDAARRAAVIAARRAYRLPYFHARMRVGRVGTRVDYESERIDPSGPPARLRGWYAPTAPAPTTTSPGGLPSATARTPSTRSCARSEWRCTIRRGRFSRRRAGSTHSPWRIRSGCSSRASRCCISARGRTP